MDKTVSKTHMFVSTWTKLQPTFQPSMPKSHREKFMSNFHLIKMQSIFTIMEVIFMISKVLLALFVKQSDLYPWHLPSSDLSFLLENSLWLKLLQLFNFLSSLSYNSKKYLQLSSGSKTSSTVTALTIIQS